jgi:hypothetical protein
MKRKNKYEGERNESERKKLERNERERKRKKECSIVKDSSRFHGT